MNEKLTRLIMVGLLLICVVVGVMCGCIEQGKKGSDLEITNVKAIGVRISMPGTPSIEKINVDAVKVNFTVKNAGNEPVTEKFYTEVYVYGSNKIKRVEITYLGPGESFTKSVVLTCPFAELRTKPVIVKVDADNVILELNEENNEKTAVAIIP